MNEEPKFTGEPRFPRFKQGDRVVYMLNSEPKFCGTVTQVNEHQGTTESNHYYTYHIRFDHGMDAKWVNEFMLMPCEDPKPEKLCKSEHSSEQFDRIIKDDFREHNRLHIAAMAMQGILSNADRMKGYEHVAATEPPYAELAVVVARNALRYADALIAAAEKGGGNHA